MPLPERVRHAAAAVTGRATLVRIDHDAVERLAAAIDPSPPAALPEERWSGTEEQRAMAVLAWNAVNFGSGWFPHVAKAPGLSGARTLATRFNDHCRRAGVPRAGTLADIDVATVTEIFGQPTSGPAAELMAHFRAAWHEFGAFLLDEHDGHALTLIDAAGGSGAALAERLAALPHWDDRHRHPGPVGDLEIPLYKRAQIVVSNLATEFAGAGPGRFDDLDTLTAFADNLVPHVLKMHGVLVVDAALDRRIEHGELLTSGEAAEVELRALGVHAVELLVGELRARGHAPVTAATIDHRLWQMGQDPAIKARPRHRCRCTYY